MKKQTLIITTNPSNRIECKITKTKIDHINPKDTLNDRTEISSVVTI